MSGDVTLTSELEDSDERPRYDWANIDLSQLFRPVALRHLAGLTLGLLVIFWPSRTGIVVGRLIGITLIVYGLTPRLHRWLSWLTLLVVLFLGIFFWPGWLFWGLVIAVMGARHPRVYDEARPPLMTRIIALVCVHLFPLCLAIVPIHL